MPTRKRLIRIHPLSAAKVSCILNIGLGLILAIFFAMQPENVELPVPREALIYLPFVYAIMGFLGGLFMAGFYNLIAATIGGIAFEVEDEPSRPVE